MLLVNNKHSLSVRRGLKRMASRAPLSSWNPQETAQSGDGKQFIAEFASNKPHSLTIKELEEFRQSCSQNVAQAEARRKIETSIMFITEELLTRLANMIREGKDLPKDLRTNDHFFEIDSQYQQSFNDLSTHLNNPKLPLSTFNDTLQRILDRHSDVVSQMAFAVHEYKQFCLKFGYPYKELAMTSYLDRFFMARIGIRFLITHHLNTARELVASQQIQPGSTQFGRVEKACLKSIVEYAYDNARSVCENLYLDAPTLVIDCADELESTYPCAHLDYIFFEILKNAMKATMERYEHADSKLTTIPPVTVLLREGREDVTIKISDQASGATTELSQRWLDYQYSTSPTPVSSDPGSSVMAGFGMGLPLSRLYARYFSGDLRIQTQEGVGTDVYIYLKNKNLEKREVLPNYSPNLQKWNFQNSVDFRNDWTGSNATKRELSNY